MPNRRKLLSWMGAAGAVGCLHCLSAGRVLAEAAPGAGPAWSYGGPTGPEHWGDLRPDFKVCKLGLEQTPIDLAGALKADAGSFALDWKPMPLRVVNNGHTIQVECEPGSSLTLGGTRFELASFHFHHPSEHLLAGKQLDLECHFVHRAASGELAVVGVFVRPGAHNAVLAPVFDAMPARPGPEQRVPGTVDPAGLLPRERAFFRYIGSLTTPPCLEGLSWTVFKEPIEASPDQIRRFAALFPDNARPVQRKNRRFLLESL